MAAANSNPQGKRCQAGAIWSPSNVQIVGSRAEILPLPAKNSRLRVLVPTMGGLHRGHMELVRIAREAAGKAGEVAVSIFVNPLQFEPGSDYERYPRPERNDEEVCRAAGVDLLFRPSAAEMYFDDRSVSVEEEALALSLCGKSRPGHFRGVCTVVAKLFNLLAPDAAVFGEKDYQQLAIIRRMVRDLNFPVEIIAAPTVREPDGLALSSRNQYLNEAERRQAPVLRAALLAAAERVRRGETSASRIVSQVRDRIGSSTGGTRANGNNTARPHNVARGDNVRIDYVEIVDAETLQPRESVGPGSLLAVAVFFGRTRLIDNILLA